MMLSRMWIIMQVEEDVIIIINEFTHEDGERRGRQIACLWQTWGAYYLRALRWPSLVRELMFSGLLKKDLFKVRWSSVEKFY